MHYRTTDLFVLPRRIEKNRQTPMLDHDRGTAPKSRSICRFLSSSWMQQVCMQAAHQLTTGLTHSPTSFFFIQLIICCRSSDLLQLCKAAHQLTTVSCMYAKQASGIHLYPHVFVLWSRISGVRVLCLLQHPASMFLYELIHLSSAYHVLAWLSPIVAPKFINITYLFWRKRTDWIQKNRHHPRQFANTQ